MRILMATARRLVFISLCATVLVACGDDDADGDSSLATATSDAALTATRILGVASDRLDATRTVHFTLGVEGRTYIDEDNTIQILSAEGNLQRPDRVQASFVANLLGRANVTIRIITVGAVTWWTDLVSGAWGLAPPEIGYDASVLFDDAIGLAPVLRAFTTSERAGIDQIDDADAYHITGRMPRSVIDDVTANTLSGETVEVQVWIDRATSNILRVVVTELEDVPDADRVTWTLDISRHDEPITIEPPI
ncbi:MAG: LppX_LprAFG lipoprotein [Thermomicrobiales bacterium]